MSELGAAPPSPDRTGSWAVVTGGSRGIGFAIARRHVTRGGNVVIGARNATNLQAACSELRRISDRDQVVEAAPADTSTPEGIEEFFAAIRNVAPYLTTFIANAGGGAVKPFLELEPKDWTDVIGLNLLGPALCCQKALQFMVDTPRPNQSVLLVSSIRAASTIPGRAVYASTKAAANQLILVLAAEMAPHKIRVNGLAPGITETTLATQAPDVFAQALRNVPLGRAGVPDDMANAAEFITGQTGAFMTGCIVTVDGGESLIRA